VFGITNLSKKRKEKKNEWVLMYKGEDDNVDAGILKKTLKNMETKRKNSLENCNKDIVQKSCGEYDVMTDAEFIMGTYSYFLKTGKAMFRQRFTRVKEETWTGEYNGKEVEVVVKEAPKKEDQAIEICFLGAKSHLYIGRFIQSGLNNDAYLDIGGDNDQHEKRGLGVCRRFFVE